MRMFFELSLMRLRIVLFLLYTLWLNSCFLSKGIDEASQAINQSFDPLRYMGVITVESVVNIYQRDTIELKTPVYIKKLDAKFTGTSSLELTIDSIEVVKIEEDSIWFKNGTDMERYLFKYVINADSAQVFVTCFYNTDSLYNENTAKCMTNTYTISKGIIVNNHDYNYCSN